MNKITKLLTAVIMMVAAFGTLSSCKKTFDNPPGSSDPNIVANTSIKDLKAMHTSNGAYDIITSDLIISGVVVADDKSGNLYKQLFIQDSTGGLQILLDANSLYGTYPVGRKIYIKCNGLCISDYNGLMELGVKALVAGLPSLEGIPANVISNYVIGGSLNNPVVPTVVTLSQLTTNMQDKYLGTLVQLDGYEFTDTTTTYADTSVYKSTVNLNIKTCTGTTTIVRNSAYADFAATKVPAGNGSIVAIYTVFGTTKQFLLRNDEDVKFTDPRCAIFEEHFSSLTVNNATFNFPGWKNIGEVGGVTYQNGVFGSTGRVVKISGFGSTQNVVTSWLITPGIALPAGSTPKLTFTTSDAFDNGATLKAFVSTDYNGSNTPSTATWTQLPATISSGHTTSTFGPFVSSGVLPLTSYAGQTIYIGFRYDGADPTGTVNDKTTTIEIDDITVLR